MKMTTKEVTDLLATYLGRLKDISIELGALSKFACIGSARKSSSSPEFKQLLAILSELHVMNKELEALKRDTDTYLQRTVDGTIKTCMANIETANLYISSF